jgi:hypothetical protein
MNLRGAKPVADRSIQTFVNSLDLTDSLYNSNIPAEFTENFYNWITRSKNNTIKGIENFTNRKLVAGSAQAFDHWYWRHKNKTFRVLDGEFMYHSAVLKHGGKIESLKHPLNPNDAVIISVPFSDYGRQHPKLESILEQCQEFDIPVLLDFAYYPCTKNINVDLDKYTCVETITFSISKAFYGAEFLRVGMRLERSDTDDGVDVFNSVDMHNRIGLSIANELIKNYSVDYNWEAYSEAYSQVCKEQELEETDCIMFGLGGDKWQHMNRGSDVNRVCISELIGEKLNGSSK